MFNKQKEPTEVDKALAKAFTHLHGYTASDKEYAVIMNQIVKLHEIRLSEKPKPVSRDTMALVAANLTGIAMIIAYEYAHVLTSKAIGIVPKLRF